MYNSLYEAHHHISTTVRHKKHPGAHMLTQAPFPGHLPCCFSFTAPLMAVFATALCLFLHFGAAYSEAVIIAPAMIGAWGAGHIPPGTSLFPARCLSLQFLVTCK